MEPLVNGTAQPNLSFCNEQFRVNDYENKIKTKKKFFVVVVLQIYPSLSPYNDINTILFVLVILTNSPEHGKGLLRVGIEHEDPLKLVSVAQKLFFFINYKDLAWHTGIDKFYIIIIYIANFLRVSLQVIEIRFMAFTFTADYICMEPDTLQIALLG